MPFSEELKLKVKQRAFFQCCLCKALYVEVHHIVPETEKGPDTEENAAPLCPSCHETYGANPVKRKFIREVRDFWYQLCAKRFKTEGQNNQVLSGLIENAASKADLLNVKDAILADIQKKLESAIERPNTTVNETKTAVASVSTILGPGVSANRKCNHCGTQIGLFIGDQGHCPNCGAVW